MNHTKNNIILISLLCFCVFINSCKKAAKEATEKVANKSAKEYVEESSEKGLRTISRKTLKQMDWDELFKLIEKENINVAKSISHLDGDFKHSLYKAFQTDPEILEAVLSSTTLIDEFTLYVQNAPKLAKDINFFSAFAKSDLYAKMYGLDNTINKLVAKEEGGLIRFLDNSSYVVATYRNGLITLNAPFVKGSHNIGENSLLKQVLIPNSVYKIKGEMGLLYLYNIDNIGRVFSVEAREVNPEEIIQNIIKENGHIDLGNAWEKDFAILKQYSKGDDVSVSCKFTYSKDNVTPTFVHVETYVKDKKVTSQTYKNSWEEMFENLTYEEANEESASTIKKIGQKAKEKFQSRYLSTIIKKTLIFKELEAIIAKGPITLSKKELKQLLENPEYLRMYIKTYGGGNFQEFFIRLSIGNKEQVKLIFQNPEIKRKVSRMIRNGGGKHEWLMAKNFEDFLVNAKWGNDGPFLALAMTRLVQNTERVIFKYGGKHGSTYSTTFHNGLAKVIENCSSKEELLVQVRKYAKKNLTEESYKEFNQIFTSIFVKAM